MKTFLQQVVNHYFTRASETLFVFPNRRSQVFFKKYFGEKMLAEGCDVMVMPSLVTISDFMKGFYTKGVLADEITLLVELYEVYREVKENASSSLGSTAHVESLDEFLFWGGVILGDFNDIDKYLADPRQLLRNISELKALQAVPEDYADKKQLEAIMKLVSSIKAPNGQSEKEIHKRFYALWDLLLPIYTRYNEVLLSKGLAYEGMIARAVAENLSEASDLFNAQYNNVQKVVFVGLNALTTAEKELLRHFRDKGLAEFCWDFPTVEEDCPFLADNANKASLFIRSYLDKSSRYYFPQAFAVHYGKIPDISVVTTSTIVGQSKLVPQFLSEIDGPVDEKTLILLPDEGQLQSVLTSIPPDVPSVNVTMGFPLSLSQACTLVVNLLKLFESKRPGYFYHKVVWDIFSSSLFRLAHESSSGEDVDIKPVRDVKAAAKVYIPTSDLSFSPLFDLPEKPGDFSAVAAYLLRSLEFIGGRLPEGRILERQAVFETYKAINRLRQIGLQERYPSLRFATYKALIIKLLSRIAIPYHGEPLAGLQVMGPLEVRALDFENIMILSAGEGIFPRKNVADSFIPYNIRRAFELPTYEHQDAIWAYYFYRLVSRAKKVWMVYNNVASGLVTGEPSRYIMQLKYGYGDKCNIEFHNAEITSRVTLGHHSYTNDKPYNGTFSASLIQKYLSCPLAFYYRYVKGIHDDVCEVSEDVESNTFGTIVHDTMCRLYTPFTGKRIQESDINALDYVSVLTENFFSQLHIDSFEGNGKAFIYFEIAKKYVEAILRTDKALARENDGFTIVALERSLEAKIGDYTIKGTLDRVDIVGGRLRIVDYKTGKYHKEDILPQEGLERTPGTVFKVFNCMDDDTWPKIALQFFIYDCLWYNNNEEYGPDKPVANVVYCPYLLDAQRENNVVEAGVPKVNIGEIPEKIYREFEQNLLATISRIVAPETVFEYREGCRACEYCKYITLCHK